MFRGFLASSLYHVGYSIDSKKRNFVEPVLIQVKEASEHLTSAPTKFSRVVRRVNPKSISKCRFYRNYCPEIQAASQLLNGVLFFLRGRLVQFRRRILYDYKTEPRERR